MTKPKPALRVLLVEDSEADAELLASELRRSFALTFVRVETIDALEAALAEGPWDLFITDFTLPRLDAMRALDTLAKSGLDLPAIVVSGAVGEEAAVSALRAGARDFIVKDRLSRLVPAIERELVERRVRVTLKNTEDQLRQSQRMEAIGSLAGGVAHDFNNILSVIGIYAEILRSSIEPTSPLVEEIGEIQTAVQRAADLTRQLLAVSRAQVLQPRLVDLNELVASMDRMLRRVIGSDIELSTLFERTGARVLVDPGQIEQVILNLVVNARDAMPGGGTLTLETDEVVLDSEACKARPTLTPGRYVKLAIRDTGTGMTAATRERIFEPFFTTKEVGRGTGLGLSTVLGIVRQSGGHIDVVSEIGRGTTFEIYLRRSEATAFEQPLRPQLHRARTGSETILLVDDDDQVREATCRLLRLNGYDVIAARSSGDALLLVEQDERSIDLLLTDVILPHMSGPKLAERIVQARPHTKVVFMTGYTGSSITHRAFVDPSLFFVQKPISSDDLLGTLRAVLEGHARVA